MSIFITRTVKNHGHYRNVLCSLSSCMDNWSLKEAKVWIYLADSKSDGRVGSVKKKVQRKITEVEPGMAQNLLLKI